MIDYIIKTYHKINVLVNNAGVVRTRMFDEISDDVWINSKRNSSL